MNRNSRGSLRLEVAILVRDWRDGAEASQVSPPVG
jgi:hypothetical protein